MRFILKGVWHSLAIVGLVAIGVGLWFWSSGITARTPPPAVETAVARFARQTMIPAAARQRQNPEAATAEALRTGLEHWADHCATCHANDGSGDIAMGRAFYPPAPDMRLPATQNLTDGELFYIIENGIKMTGMPAWGGGTEEGERMTWELVHFIRHLPSLDEAEIAEMEALNPRSADEWRALEEEQRFLRGDTPLPPGPPATHDHKGVPQ